MSRPKGFSLIELLMVMVILAVGASVASYSWIRMSANSNLRAAGRDIESDLKLLKERAKTDASQDYTIVFNLGTNSYSMTGLTGAKSPADFANHIRITKVVSVTSGTYTITSLARGTFSPASGSVILTNSRGSTAKITFNVTGRTYVEFNIK